MNSRIESKTCIKCAALYIDTLKSVELLSSKKAILEDGLSLFIAAAPPVCITGNIGCSLLTEQFSCTFSGGGIDGAMTPFALLASLRDAGITRDPHVM